MASIIQPYRQAQVGRSANPLTQREEYILAAKSWCIHVAVFILAILLLMLAAWLAPETVPGSFL